MREFINIAIDGPSGAGKSTIAKALAEKLNITYLDTGAMYRTLGLKALRENIDLADEAKVIEMLNRTDVKIKFDGGSQIQYLDGENVAVAIREHRVSKAASDISKIPAVREKLVALQREIALGNDIVLDGRDITSYVLPNANYKFYITASAEERASRRYKELIAKGEDVKYEQILSDINDRDYNDMNRACCPLIRTKDSYYLDTTDKTIGEVIDIIIKEIKSQ